MNRHFSGLMKGWVVSWMVVRMISAAEAGDRLVVNADLGKTTIDRNIYGHFSEHLGRCIYEGYWVGEGSPIPNVRGIRTDVVEALKKIRVPVMRWPGGCFADEYHWMDGIGPRTNRPSIVNVHWGGVTENNHFGTHEFLDLCGLLGAEPYICGNLGSGGIREMRDWVEYLTMDGQSPMADMRRENGRELPWKVPFFGVGNENWGCGGDMTPEYYANEYRRYASYVRHFGGNRVKKIACGANGFDYRWTEVLMREAGRYMDGLSLHYYCGTGRRSRSATSYDEGDWFHVLRSALRMEELLSRHSAIMDQYDPQRRVSLIVDEWGTWHAVEPGSNPGFLYQQNSIRDALVAAVNLNLFNQHAERVRMANIAQTVNVLQAMVLTRGPAMLLTPTYHVFEMFVPHHGATLLPTELACAPYELGGESIPGLSASASRDASGRVNLTLCNLNPERAAELAVELRGATLKRVSGRILTAPTITAHNTFEQPDQVAPSEFTGASISNGGVSVKLPGKSVVVLTLD
jgi:alpha-N-arabinofuranosidase